MITVTTTTSDGATKDATFTLTVGAVNEQATLSLNGAVTTFVEDATSTKAGAVVATYAISDQESDAQSIVLSDTTNYSHDASSKTIKLTTAGATLANSGQPLPNFTIQAKDRLPT